MTDMFEFVTADVRLFSFFSTVHDVRHRAQPRSSDTTSWYSKNQTRSKIATTCTAMDGDSFLVLEKSDTREDRYYWYCHECPCSEACVTSDWEQTQAWSFTSETIVRANVYSHLMNSDNHKLDHELAKVAANSAEILCLTETYDERERYRNLMRTTQQNASHAIDAEDTDRATDSEQRWFNKTMETSLALCESLRGEVGIAIRCSEKRSFDGNYKMNPQRLRMVMDTVDRTSKAMESTKKLFRNAAEKFQDRSLACIKAAAALQDEHDVLSEARECMADMARNM
jgi:hypothetical protein